MFIVFNFFALIQSIILAVFLGCFFELEADDYLYAHGFTKGQVNFLFMYLLFVLLSATEYLGIKGRLFWLPSWFLAFAVLLLISFGGTVVPEWPKWCVGIMVLASGYGVLAALDYKFRKGFYERQGVLQAMADTVPDSHPEVQKQFWKQMRKSFVQPSKFYNYSYNLYKLLNPKTIAIEDFDAHNLKLVNTMQPVVIEPNAKMKLEHSKTMLEYRIKNAEHGNHTDTIQANIKEVLRTYA
ncbi:MAG: hypothetical protein V4581_01590 [Bacteroidota bacterium]